jgi:hypothetical protein
MTTKLLHVVALNEINRMILPSSHLITTTDEYDVIMPFIAGSGSGFMINIDVIRPGLVKFTGYRRFLDGSLLGPAE